MARLAHLLGVWIEPRIALVLAPTPLEILLLNDVATGILRLVALGALVLECTLALETVIVTGSTGFEDHVRVLIVGAVINAGTILQEKAILTGCALSILSSIATRAIGMTFDAHVEVTSACDGLGSLEVAITPITHDDRVVAGIHAVGWRIENLSRVTGQAVQIGRAKALLARRKARVTKV
jgi:hypothetical protein